MYSTWGRNLPQPSSVYSKKYRRRRVNRHCIRLCTWTQSWDTSDSNCRRPFWLPSWKICNWYYWFLHIHILRPWFYINRHFICLCIQKESWDTLDCNFRRQFWPPSWKICNWCYWVLHIHTLRPSLHINRHFIEIEFRFTFCWERVEVNVLIVIKSKYTVSYWDHPPYGFWAAWFGVLRLFNG